MTYRVLNLRPTMIQDRLRAWASAIKRDLTALYLAMRDPRVPWYVKLLAGVVVAYALSPIDLIPDFVPIVGYLDDLILVPLGMLLIIRLMPPGLIEEYRVKAMQMGRLPASRRAVIVIVGIWIVAAAVLGTLAYNLIWQPNSW